MNAQFTGVFDVLHRYIGDGEDNADFVTRIIAMLTKEPIEDSKKHALIQPTHTST